MSEPDQYYVIGNPVKHSLSPCIHNAFARQTGQNMLYSPLEIPEDDFDATMERLKNEPIKGLSITVPYKEAILPYVNHLDNYAQLAEAVSNIIVNDDNEWTGINLDGLGLVNDLQRNHHCSLQDKRILILGAGGSAKGILGALFAEMPAAITIANRTVKKAHLLAQRSAPLFEVQATDIYDIGDSYDVIINATALSLTNTPPPLEPRHFNTGAFGYDLMYAPEGTAFTRWCQDKGIAAADGKGMLLELSREIFYRWRGVSITDAMINHLDI